MPRGQAESSPHPVDRHVGRRIAEKRLALGYNQSELGRALSLTFQQIQKYEKGTNRVSASKLWLIAQFFKVDLSYFFDGLSEDTTAADPDREAETEARPTRQSIEIGTLVPTLGLPQQKLILDLVKSMATQTKADS
ncbi:MAG: XRE family transcriptional regulator [Alphaproteobacteria bacterium]|nr:MAG: XRE family transcriptional regulator [Alphaproteobacteria bacterium]